MRLLRKLSLLPLACLATLAGARNPDVRLPDIGSSAAAIMSPQELHEYGAGMLQELRGYGLVLDDALLNDYLDALGYRLVAHSDQPDSAFTFFIMRDPSINAFAAPGGFVAANAGLITAMDTEDELAGVLAHEIAHVQQQHILRAFEDTQKMSIPIMIGMLGVMIASAGRTDDAAPAALVAGTSLMQQRQINFTRSEEGEADHVGIQTLARAGFDPVAMAGAFATLQKIMRVNGVDVPEFLLDHPLDTRRIADAKARAAQLGCPVAPRLDPLAVSGTGLGALDLTLPSRAVAGGAATVSDAAARAASEAATITIEEKGEGAALPRVSVSTCAPRDPAGESYFELMRERARVLTAPSPAGIRGYYADSLRQDPAFDTLANRYGYALALVRAGQPGDAVSQLRPLVEREPSSAVLRLALAHAQDQAGSKAEALATYRQLERDFPGNRSVALTYADALLARTDVAHAQQALALLRPLVERRPDDPELQRSYGRANQLAGDTVRAAEAYAEAAWLTGHAEDALAQLKALSKQSDLSYYQRSRIDARITQLTPAVLERRKREGVPEPDSLTPAFACCQRR
jgi:predicted Zn-dependent protease